LPTPPHLGRVGRPQRLTEQGRSLRLGCPSRRPGPDHPRGGPQTPRRPHWAHRRTPHLGIGTDPPSARPYHRAGRRLLARRPALDCLPARFLPVRPSALTPLPPPVPGKADHRVPSRAPEFFADQAALAEPAVFKAHLGALRKVEWVVYAKPPFGGPDAVLAYLSRYTHRIAIANSRLVAFDGERVTFKWKDYRAKADA